MFKRTMLVAVLAAMVSVCVGVSGQEPVENATETAKLDPVHFKAAMGLLEAMNTETTLAASIDQMLDIQVKQQPMLAPFKEVMRKFFKKHMSWDVLKDDLAKIYMEEFTTAELDELAAFYRTPTGKKMAEKLPILTQKQAMLGASRVQGNMRELQEMLIEEQAKQTAPQDPMVP